MMKPDDEIPEMSAEEFAGILMEIDGKTAGRLPKEDRPAKEKEPLSQSSRYRYLPGKPITASPGGSGVYDIAGASAIRRNGTLQRLYRDASCLTHHITVSDESFERIGRVRSGFDPLNWMI